MAGHLFGGEMPKEETFYEELGKKIVYWTVPSASYGYLTRDVQIKCKDKTRAIRLGHGCQGNYNTVLRIGVRNSEAERGPAADRYFEQENIVVTIRTVEGPKAINSPNVGSLNCKSKDPGLVMFEAELPEGKSGKASLGGFHAGLEITVLKKMKVA
jgi:hypothetical protein